MGASNNSAIIVFLKNFEPGQVKTRLARTLGDAMAMEIYRRMCDYIVTEVQNTGLLAYYFFSDFIDQSYLRDLGVKEEDETVKLAVQTAGDLGDRMRSAFHVVLKNHSHALIIGTDCPYLNADSILQSVEVLESTRVDVVIGPAADGGYYALGMDQSYELFSGIPWSTGRELAQTMGRCKDLGLQYALLPELEDIDNEEDWNAFRSSSYYAYFEEVINSNSSRKDTDG